MAQFWLQVSSEADRDLFTVDSWGSAATRFTFNAATETIPASLRLGETSSTNSSDRVLATFTAAGAVADAEVIAYGGVCPRPGGGGPCVRAVDRSNLFYSRVRRATASPSGSLVRNDGGAWVELAASGDVDAVSAMVWSAIRLDGNRIRSATWAGGPGDISSFPGWQSDVTDAAYAGARPVGVYSPNRPEYRFHILAIGTDGDPAPTGPVGPGGSRHTSPLLLTPW